MTVCISNQLCQSNEIISLLSMNWLPKQKEKESTAHASLFGVIIKDCKRKIPCTYIYTYNRYIRLLVELKRKFRVHTYLSLIDTSYAHLKNRSTVYKEIDKWFRFLSHVITNWCWSVPGKMQNCITEIFMLMRSNSFNSFKDIAKESADFSISSLPNLINYDKLD